MPARAAIYLDYNAGAPLHPRVIEGLPFFIDSIREGGNPSSTHAPGRRFRRELIRSRARVAKSLGSPSPESLLFASSGTEANQWVIRSMLRQNDRPGESTHWITSTGEHDSVLRQVAFAHAQGIPVSQLSLERSGQPTWSRLDQILQSEDKNAALCVSLLWVNNETGVILDLDRLGEWVRRARDSGRRVWVHLDAAQAWGKLPIDVMRPEFFADYVSLSGHKIGALGGCGTVWRRYGAVLRPMLEGHQESELRGGTENLMGAWTMGLAADALAPVRWAETVRPLQAHLEGRLRSVCPGIVIHGQSSPRVANTTNFTWPGWATDSLLPALDLEGFALSAGSACRSGSVEPSHVLGAMGLDRETVRCAVRVSIGEGTTVESLDHFVEALVRSAPRNRESLSAIAEKASTT